jgi:hypothetical protein
MSLRASEVNLLKNCNLIRLMFFNIGNTLFIEVNPGFPIDHIFRHPLRYKLGTKVLFCLKAAKLIKNSAVSILNS